MAIYQLRVKQEYMNEELINVFYYKSVAGTPSADDFIDVFADDVWDLVRAIQSDGVDTIEYYAINGDNNLDFEVRPTSDAGALTGTSGANAPAFLAYAMRSPSGGPGTRYSYKRFGGVKSGSFNADGSGTIGAAFRTILEPAQDALGLVLEGVNASYQPIQITGGFILGEAPIESYSLQGQWTTDLYLSTQKTRQQYLWSAISS